jgi:uncharacterized membrane protein
MKAHTAGAVRELLFRLSISLKGAHAALEICGGLALLFTKPDAVLRIVALVTQDELVEDPNDPVANYALHVAQALTPRIEQFAAWYLLSHGVVKLLLVSALLRTKLWAYPVSMIVFGLFIGYQVYRYTFTHSPLLLALSVFDGLVIWLIWLEYQALRRPTTS